MNRPETFRIGEFLLTPQRRRLTRAGADLRLGSRAFDLLLALIEREGRLATKDELMAEVWPGTIVDENNLAAQISILRKVLSSDPALARDLQTVPGRGYRLVARVEPLASEPVHATPAPAPAHAGEAPSLVVLPFASLSSVADQAYFAEGLSQTVSTDLSRIAGLLVISSATAASFKCADLDIRRICAALDVRYALAGSVQRSGRKVRFNAQLIDGRTGVQLWSELFDGDATDVFTLQDHITGRIANALGREIFVAAAREGRARQVDPSSLDLLMRGIAADNRPQSLESLQAQEALFARAVELDPDNSEALARLARAIVIQITQAHRSSGSKSEALERGAKAAEQAVRLDPCNPRGHYAMGLVHVLRGDFERSARANEAAIALDRNFALAHNNHGNSLVHLGNGAAALSAVETALRLDPRGPQVGSSWTVMGFARLLLGDHGCALQCFSHACTANPQLPRAHVGAAIALATGGDETGARAARAELLALVPSYRLAQTIDACSPKSPVAYRRFYEEVLRPGAERAGLPV